MPTYAYACKQCGHRFDAVQSFADPALTECPVCGGELKKEYGSIGVTFNGSGFYRTDSRATPSEGGGEKGGGEKGSSASDAKSGASGGQAKSAPSSDTSSRPSAASPTGS